MQHDVAANRPVEFLFIALIFCRLNAAEGSCCSAKTRIAAELIVIIKLSAGGTARPFACQKIVQEFFVGCLLRTKLRQKVIIQAPAYIIVAAKIIQEGEFPGQTVYNAQLVLQKPDILRRHSVPGRRHRRDIIEHITLRFFDCAEIRHNLAGLHHHLAQQQRSGTDHSRRQTQEPYQTVDLGLVAAVSAAAFPDIGHCIQANDIHSVITKIEHGCGHVIEHCRVGVVQIPLIGIEHRHDHLTGLTAPGEIPRSRRREDIWNIWLELIGNIPSVKKEIACLSVRIPGPGFLRPLVLIAGMIHHKIKTDSDVFFVAVPRQASQILHAPQPGVHLRKVRNRIASVALILRAFQKRHQMDIIHPAFLDIRQMLPDSLKSPGKTIHIEAHPERPSAFVPA